MSYPIETKIALVREYEQGKKVAEVSKTSGIPENSIYRWIREYQTIKTASSAFLKCDSIQIANILHSHNLSVQLISSSTVIIAGGEIA